MTQLCRASKTVLRSVTERVLAARKILFWYSRTKPSQTFPEIRWVSGSTNWIRFEIWFWDDDLPIPWPQSELSSLTCSLCCNSMEVIHARDLLYFRNSCLSWAGSSTFVNLEIRLMTSLQSPDLARLSKPLLPSSPSDDRWLADIFGECQLDTLDPVSACVQSALHGQVLLDSGRNHRAEILFLTPSKRQCPFWKMVSMFDSSPTCPLVSLLLCLTLPRAKDTPKVCSGSSVFLCVAAQEPTPYNVVFLNKQEFFPAGLWDTFLDLRGAVCVKFYHSSTVWILSSDYQLFGYSKWVLQAVLIYQHSSLVNISSLSELAFIFLPLFKMTDMFSLNLFCVLCFWWS